MIGQKPDIITKETKLIELGKLENILIDLKDNIIDKDKRSNKSLQSGYWISLDGEIYYFKIPPFTQSYINELLGEKISLEFGLETVHNQLATAVINRYGEEVKIYGILSKWARKKDYNYNILKNELIHNRDFSLLDSNNLSILDLIDQIYQNQAICKQIRYFITREFFTQETDRLQSELLIATKGNNTELGFLTDYEYEFMKFSSQYSLSGLLKLDLSESSIINQIKNDLYFQEAFTKALEIDSICLLDKIIEEYKIRLIDYDKNNYKEHERQMKKIITSKKII